jgi:GAF domain-containing protein
MSEAARLAELASYGILDTGPEQPFDDIVALAARRFAVPTALLSFIDADRQWFKARHGFAFTQTERDIAFCDRCVRSGRPLVVTDATSHPQFALNPLVVGAPYIYFYAGAPLITPGGHCLGALCVIDANPRPAFGPEDLHDLQALAHMAVAQLRLRRAAAQEGKARAAA